MRKITFEDLQEKNHREDSEIIFDSSVSNGQTYFSLETGRINPVPAELISVAVDMINNHMEAHELDVDMIKDKNIHVEINLGVRTIDANTSELFLEVFTSFRFNDFQDEIIIDQNSDFYKVAREYFLEEVTAFYFKD